MSRHGSEINKNHCHSANFALCNRALWLLNISRPFYRVVQLPFVIFFFEELKDVCHLRRLRYLQKYDPIPIFTKDGKNPNLLLNLNIKIIPWRQYIKNYLHPNIFPHHPYVSYNKRWNGWSFSLILFTFPCMVSTKPFWHIPSFECPETGGLKL